MAWTSITKPTLGEATKKSLADAIIDDLSDLNSRVSLVANAALQNGSFEYDADADGVPDNWTKTLYTGGSSAIETTDVAHGQKSYKFVSPGGAGNGGGYLASDDYIPCSPYRFVFIDFLIKSSAAGIHNLVELLWYDKAKSYLSLTAVYDETVANPTDWKRYVLGKMPPASAVYCRVRLTGAKNDDTASGTCYFDGVSVYDIGDSGQVYTSGIAENLLSNSSTWTDSGSVAIMLPPLSNTLSLAVLTFIAQQKGADCEQRFRIGSSYSDEKVTASGTYVDKRFSLPYEGTGGSVTLYQQLKVTSGTGAAYGKLTATDITIELVLK